MMKILSDRQSVAANTTTGNVLAGKNGEFLRGNHAVRIGPVAAAVGMQLLFSIGGEMVYDDQEVSGANVYPVDPDHFIATPGGLDRDQLVARWHNTTGAAIVAVIVVQLIPQ